MAKDLWGESPLYENEGLKVGRIPTVTPIDQGRDEGDCGEATRRGEEACECVGKLTKNRRQPHSRPSGEAAFAVRKTEQKPETRPVRTGEWAKHHEARPKNRTPCSSALVNRGASRTGEKACAAKVIRLIQGDPLDVSITQAGLKAEPPSVNGGGVGRKSAEAVVLPRRIPATTGRAEP